MALDDAPVTTVNPDDTVAASGTGRARIHTAVLLLASLVFAAHLAVVMWGPYGPHRDALLYYAMGEHLRLFSMDFPPFIAIVARTLRAIADSELLLHVPVAAAHAALIVFAAAFARRAGGSDGAQLLAAAAVALAPAFMRAGSLYQPVVFDQLWWTWSLWVLAGFSDDANARGRWLKLGAVLGLGLLTKFTILVLGTGILVALLATPLRRALATPWPWLAAALAFVIGSPSIVGQVVLGFPFFGQFNDLQSVQLDRVTPVTFMLEQLLLVGPILLIAVVPAMGVLRSRDAGLRAVVIAAAAAFILMLLAGGKPYYIAPIWPALTGIGIAGALSWLARRVERRATRSVAVAALWLIVVGNGAVALPLGLPFLPPEPAARYAAWLGVTSATTTNTGEHLPLPQDYADMLGWEDLARATEDVWRALPPAERERAVIIATNYGRAGAIDYFASDDLPPVLAPVGSYWFWGPGERTGAVAVVVGGDADELRGRYYRDVVEVTRVRRPWGVPEEQDVPIVIARDPVRTLQEVWPDFRGVN